VMTLQRALNERNIYIIEETDVSRSEAEIKELSESVSRLKRNLSYLRMGETTPEPQRRTDPVRYGYVYMSEERIGSQWGYRYRRGPRPAHIKLDSGIGLR
jgi:hypothetical protein